MVQCNKLELNLMKMPTGEDQQIENSTLWLTTALVINCMNFPPRSSTNQHGSALIGTRCHTTLKCKCTGFSEHPCNQDHRSTALAIHLAVLMLTPINVTNRKFQENRDFPTKVCIVCQRPHARVCAHTK